MGQLQRRYFNVRVTRPDGGEADVHEWGYAIPGAGEFVFATPLPGTYRIRFGAGAEVSITVSPMPGG